MNFHEHLACLKKELGVSPRVFIDEEGKKYLEERGFKHLNGGYEKENNTIALKKSKRILTLAHEMRHAWQFENKEKYNFNFNGEKQTNYLISKKEMDANLFAFKYGMCSGLKLKALIYLASIPIMIIIYALIIAIIAIVMIYNYMF